MTKARTGIAVIRKFYKIWPHLLSWRDFAAVLALSLLMAFSGTVFLSTTYRGQAFFLAALHEMPDITDLMRANTDLTPANLSTLLSEKLVHVQIRRIDGSFISAGTPDQSPLAFYDSRQKFKLHYFFDMLHQLTNRAPPPVRVTLGDHYQAIVLDLSQITFQSEIRTFFLVCFSILGTALTGLGMVIQFWMRRKLVEPLADLIATINSFSQDPTITRPVPTALTSNKDYIAAARALEELQRNMILALRQRERLAELGEAVAKITHDIRNALSAATLLADTLLTSRDPRVKRSAPHVVQSLEQAAGLCQSILDYLVESPKPVPELLDMRALADDIATQTGLAIKTAGPDHILADSMILNRILLNLARNAVTAGASEVTVDVWKAGHLGVIDIADNGPGIPRALWKELFIPFRRHNFSGTGLGLAIARDLAAVHGGDLKLSRSNENGTEFRLQLPANIFWTGQKDRALPAQTDNRR